jgi:glycogen debranching enzyme
MSVGKSVTFVATTEAEPSAGLDGEKTAEKRVEHEAGLLQTWLTGNDKASESPSWTPQLVLAADQFVVKRSLPGNPDGKSIIAGYHWFGDWGRDAMIALPGVTLATGRAGRGAADSAGVRGLRGRRDAAE